MTPPARPLRLVLARHGQTPANVDRLLDTRLPGPGLTGLGREQAAALGRELADAGVDALYHSPARRAEETAGIVAGVLGLEPATVEGTYEVQVGDDEGRSDDEAVARFREVFDRWQAGDLDVAHRGGESGRDLLRRFVPAVDAIRARHPGGGTVVLVSHGGALRLAAQELVGHVGTPDPEDNHLGNCGRVELESTDAADGPGGGPAWRLLAWRREVPGGLPSVRDDATG